METYLIVIEKAEEGYSAYAPDVVGCGVGGDTLDETIHLMKDALEFHFRGIAEDGDDIPLPSGVNAYNLAVHQSEMEEYFLTHIAVRLPQTNDEMLAI
jgi:predicted RNase H-like HicB family nuclease